MKTFEYKDNKLYIKFRVENVDFNRTLAVVKSLENRWFDSINKQWIATATQKNIDVLLNNGFNADPNVPKENEIYVKNETPFVPVDRTKLPKGMYDYQMRGVEFLEAVKGNGGVFDEMGCIDGEAIVSMNRATLSRKTTLKKAFNMFHNNKLNLPTYIRGLKSNGRFGLLLVKDILYKGKKAVLELETNSGKKIIATPDHEFLTKDGWKRLDKLQQNEEITVNGTSICPLCGSTENIIIKPTSKFLGYCKKCMYTKLRNGWKYEDHRFISKSDGYVYLRGKKYADFHRKSSSGVLEHIYLMEQYLGRELTEDEEVHHINRIRSDNRLENLKVLNRLEHMKEHNAEQHFKDFVHWSGSEVIMIPKYERVVSINAVEDRDVYDVIVDDVMHNFIANGIVVHNCGKSIQSLAYTKLHPEDLPCLIICPATLKLNWQREIAKWLKAPSTILYSKDSIPIILSNIKYYIINYDILEGWKNEILKFGFKLIIGDEVQYISNFKAIRTKAFVEISKKIPKRILLSGTPLKNNPSNFFTALNILAPKEFPNRWKYLNRYMNQFYNGFAWTFKGSKNEKELHNRIVPYMIRRTKKDVLTELPDKTRVIIPFEMNPNNISAYNKAEQSFIQWAVDNKQKKLDGQKHIEILKQLAYIGKRNDVIDWIKDFLETGKKLVVFVYHKEAIKDLYNVFKKISVVVSGDTSMKDRQDAIDKFQLSEDTRLFIGQINAAGVGITLTAASDVAFTELAYTPSDMFQAEDRVHRIGQKADKVTAYYLVAANTVEEDIALIVDEKYKLISKIIDGIDPDGMFNGKDFLDEITESLHKRKLNEAN